MVLTCKARETDLTAPEDGSDAVEQLERVENTALHKNAGTESGCHPPARAHGHLVEPLLQRELAHHAVTSHNICHGRILEPALTVGVFPKESRETWICRKSLSLLNSE
jgi:hypothetical protein